MKERDRKYRLFILLILLLLVASSISTVGISAAGSVRGGYLYSLSNFTGPIRDNDWAKVFVDKERTEIYVLYQNLIRVFNGSGMEVYHFGDDLDLGHIVDGAIDKDGNILLLNYGESGFEITRCNFRGEPIGKIEIKNLPNEFSGFSPNRMVYFEEKLYMISLMGMKLIITDGDGKFKEGYDLFSFLQVEENQRADSEINGFSVGNDGSILFTIPSLFKAYVISPDRKFISFGKPGSAPGKFNIVAGIVKDHKGNIVVVDKLKSAILVFDKSYNFLTEFGYRGNKRGNLLAPDDIAIDNQNRIYVTQAGKKGVSVFSLGYD
jgi:hypothetical protein